MSELRMVGRPELERPVLIAAFRGWNDGGQGATLAAGYLARVSGAERDAVLLLGVEPSLRWKTFSRLVLELARDLDVQLVITLGSLLADVPHTRAAPGASAGKD